MREGGVPGGLELRLVEMMVIKSLGIWDLGEEASELKYLWRCWNVVRRSEDCV